MSPGWAALVKRTVEYVQAQRPAGAPALPAAAAKQEALLVLGSDAAIAIRASLEATIPDWAAAVSRALTHAEAASPGVPALTAAVRAEMFLGVVRQAAAGAPAVVPAPLLDFQRGGAGVVIPVWAPVPR